MRSESGGSLTLATAAFCLLGLAAAAEAPPPAPAPEIWIKTGARVAATAPIDVMWTPDAPWSTVAAHVKVAGFPPGNIERAKDADLQATFREMKRRNIAMALGTGLLTQTASCHAWNEAMGGPGEFENMLKKIERNGGDLRYIVMDEPYYYGHQDASGCHQSAMELAANVAQSVATARRIFPNVTIGDVEVVNASRPWIQELTAWADAYRAAVGEKLAYMQTDVQWSEPAMRNLKPLAAAMHARGIPLGIIYNADAAANTDESWQQSAESHITYIETALGIHPDIASFDSWTAHPSHRLPETASGTLTNIALGYLRTPTSLSVVRQGNGITGGLTDAQGRPVAAAGVTVTALDVGARMEPTLRSLSGMVPEGASAAIIGVRIDSDGACACDGDGSATIGTIRYQEQRTGKQQAVWPGKPPALGPPPAFRTLKISHGSAFDPNLKQFKVTAGASYTFSAPISATASAANAGYATIIFLDAQGKGMKRDVLWFTPSQQDVGQLKTNADGRFSLSLSQALASSRPEIRVLYAGDDHLRPALAIADSQ